MILKHFSAIYRMQGKSSKNYDFSNINCPMKRVIVRKDGYINFNPDNNKFVYFSKNINHHCYYIFNKIIKIINTEIDNYNNEHKANLCSQSLRKFHCYGANINVINEVKKIFLDYFPPKYIEVISMRYLWSFTRLFEDCAIINRTNKVYGLPEQSDVSKYGGAYGMNSEWLDLLNCCTDKTEIRSFSIDNFFDFLKYKTPRTSKAIADYEALCCKNPLMMEFLKDLTGYEYFNPKFKDKNNLNDVVSLIEEIERQHLYNSSFINSKEVFIKAKKQLNEDITRCR